MGLIILGLLVSLLLPWSVGYILVLHLAPGVFRPRQIELATSLLLGVCVMGVVLILPITLLDGHSLGRLVAFWSMPMLGLAGLLSLLVRYKHKLQLISVRKFARYIAAQRIGNLFVSGSSIAILLIGTVLLVVTHPPSDPTVELYAIQVGDTFQISVTSSSAQPQQMILVTTSATNPNHSSVALDPVSAASGPTTVTLPAGANIVELYNGQDDITLSHPIRRLVLSTGGSSR
jgi:hypothetical protein